jgi:hypothetical protein
MLATLSVLPTKQAWGKKAKAPDRMLSAGELYKKVSKLYTYKEEQWSIKKAPIVTRLGLFRGA